MLKEYLQTNRHRIRRQLSEKLKPIPKKEKPILSVRKLQNQSARGIRDQQNSIKFPRLNSSQINVKMLPLIPDDYNKRIPIYTENLCINRLKPIQVTFSMTDRFYFVTFGNTKKNRQYKVRLTHEVGSHICGQINGRKQKSYFKDKIYRDQQSKGVSGCYFLIIPWAISFRKYIFTRIEKAPKFVDSTQDNFLRQEIGVIGRDSLIFSTDN